MGIYEIKTKDRTANWNLEGATYTQTYDVVVDVDDDHFTVLSEFASYEAVFYPGAYYHGTYLFDFAAKQLNTDAQSYDGHNQTALWEVQITYKTLKPEEQEKAEQIEPLDRSPIISFQTREVEKIVEKDNAGNAICNSAGDPYNPALTKRAGAFVVIVKKNYNYPLPFDPSLYIFKTNSGSFLGYSSAS